MIALPASGEDLAPGLLGRAEHAAAGNPWSAGRASTGPQARSAAGRCRDDAAAAAAKPAERAQQEIADHQDDDAADPEAARDQRQQAAERRRRQATAAEAAADWPVRSSKLLLSGSPPSRIASLLFSSRNARAR